MHDSKIIRINNPGRLPKKHGNNAYSYKLARVLSLQLTPSQLLHKVNVIYEDFFNTNINHLNEFNKIFITTMPATAARLHSQYYLTNISADSINRTPS